MEQKSIVLPKLDGLTPSLESTALKLMEEAGELAQAIGKFRGLSGEVNVYDKDEVVGYISEELLDVAQTAVSMMYVLEDMYDINLDDAVTKHIEKLAKKGYIR